MHLELFRWTAFAAFAALTLNWLRAGFWALPTGRLFVVARVCNANGIRADDAA